MEVSAKAIEMVAEEIQKRGVSYDEISDATLLSKSTISRVVKNKKASSFTLKQLVAYLEMGEQYRALVGDEPDSGSSNQLAADLMIELAAQRAEWKQRFHDMQSIYEGRITFMEHQLLSNQEERAREREKQESIYDRSTGHLIKQTERLQRNNDLLVTRLVDSEKEEKESALHAIACEATKDAAQKALHRTYLFCAFIVAALAIALLIALSTDKLI